MKNRRTEEQKNRRTEEQKNSSQGSINVKHQTIFEGDNLPILRGINSNSIDLIYLDPPFNSNANYAAPIGSQAAGAAFKDTWTLKDVDETEHGLLAETHPALYKVIHAARESYDKSMMSYLIMMSSRLLELSRILKPSGSLYLHCDSTAGHYLKVLLDALFGKKQFQNDIAWCYRRLGNSRLKRFARCHDMLLFYKMSKTATFNADAVRRPYADSSLEREGYQKTSIGQRGPLSGLCELNKKGRFPDDWWDIPILRPNARERTGHPTQKPLALLEPILKASSNPGDVVLDPFCGCATTCIAAEKLERRWIGIDISSKAAELVKDRMRKDLGLFSSTIIHRTDLPQRTDIQHLSHYKTHKHTLFGKQEGLCIGCHVSFPFRNFTIDHKTPKNKGGSDHFENLQLLCNACNSMKGTKTQAEFLALLKQQGSL